MKTNKKKKKGKRCPYCQDKILKPVYIGWFKEDKNRKPIMEKKVAFCSKNCLDKAVILSKLVIGCKKI